MTERRNLEENINVRKSAAHERGKHIICLHFGIVFYDGHRGQTAKEIQKTKRDCCA